MTSFSSYRLFGFSPTLVLWTLLVCSALCRWFIAATLPILPDEAYYYQWSQHLDASYYSKGPAVAYTIALGTWLFGPTTLGVRFFAVLLSVGTSWQLFLLTRRWFDEKTAVLAVLIAFVVPIYALGAVVMTIDPLSAFFWLWAANFFSDALEKNRWRDWLLAGFAVGAGFLAKQLNAMELLAFLGFLILEPSHRHQLRRAPFWVMVLTAFACTVPVWYWNEIHHWPMTKHLAARGDLGHWWQLQFATVWKFLLPQVVVVSPLLFGLLIGTAVRSVWQKNIAPGERLLLYLFLSVFGFYAILSLHYAGEPNWPAISYLTLIPILAHRMARALVRPIWRVFLVLAVVLSLMETVVLHATPFLPLPGRLDPLSRVQGWREMAEQLQAAQQQTGATVLIADEYKEAAVLSFYLPQHAFVYARKEPEIRNAAGQRVPHFLSQYDLWPSYESAMTQKALYITENPQGLLLKGQFHRMIFNRQITVFYRGVRLRNYYLFLLEN